MNKLLICAIALLGWGCVTKQVRKTKPVAPKKELPPTRPDPAAVGTLTSGHFALPSVAQWFSKRKGYLLASQARPVLKGALPSVRQCLKKMRQRLPSASERFRFRLWIGPRGKVWKSQYKGDVIADPRTLKCLRFALHKLQFPPPGGFMIWQDGMPLE